jgi:hypothetical protein
MSTDEHANGRRRRTRDELLVAQLASGATYADAATACGVSKATVARRMGEPDFRARVGDARREVVDTVRGKIIAASTEAVLALAALATGARSESVRLGAARSLLELALEQRGRFAAIERHDFVRVVRELIDIALKRLPDDQVDGFLHEIDAMASR